MNIEIPKRIGRITEISRNLWWSWDPLGRDLFRALHLKLWDKSRHNSIEMLNNMTQEQIDLAAADPAFLKVYDRTVKKYDDYMDLQNKWYTKYIDPERKHKIAYFSFEFGLHQSLPIYSGGLGVLAGDTCKEASDLGLPFVGIGYFYHQGYFKQYIPPHGYQEAEFTKVNFDNIPISPVMNGEDRLILEVDLVDEVVKIHVWEIEVGTIKLYLLDTDIDANKPWFRSLSSRLYGGAQEMRINQEIVLGIGGVKLLKKLNYIPSVWHLNEGHCSFLTIERISDLVKSGKSFQEAFDYVKKTTIFTTHTPVPAGHDSFTIDRVVEKFQGRWEELGISREQFLNLGINKFGDDNRFNMTVLGINTSHIVNGVSKLHYNVTKEMWKDLFDERKADTKLIGITNGVHIPTFISGPMRRIFNKYIHYDWMNRQDNVNIWEKIYDIPDEEFWLAHVENKTRLMEYIRETARSHRKKGVMDAEQILASGTFLDPNALTIGFARRFATYKRADLIFRDIERIHKMLNDPYRPLQIIFAGKAHPADEPGKHLLQNVYLQALSSENGGRVAFIENYDMHVARYLVQGVDIWMNTPIRPHEASGTSGMKAAVNGVPHFSISDGWWAEGYDGSNGWVIGDGKEMKDPQQRDLHDVSSLYDTLEKEIIPLYYARDEDGIPRRWIKVMKESVKTSLPTFSMSRFSKDYVYKMYVPSFENSTNGQTE